MPNLTTEQEAQKYYYHSMLRAMGEDRCFHRPPMNRNEELIAQDNKREQEKRTYGPNDIHKEEKLPSVIDAMPRCDICGSTENLRIKRVIYTKVCYNNSKIVFYRCPNCGG
jgi:hypothetical protein